MRPTPLSVETALKPVLRVVPGQLVLYQVVPGPRPRYNFLQKKL
jgi:hypothetical protein